MFYLGWMGRAGIFRTGWVWGLLLGAMVLGVGGAVVGSMMWDAPLEVAAVRNEAPVVVRPSFDVVRVGRDGAAVIAGRAVPGAEVAVFAGETEIGRGRADQRGEFVVLPAAPLVQGAQALTLRAQGADGGLATSEGSVVVVVPAAKAEADGALAVLLPKTAPAQVLQGPAPTAGAVSLDIVDYDEGGSIRFKGRVQAGSVVRLYVDGGVVGEGVAGGDGVWTVTPGAAVAQGVHRVRVDRIDAAGRVVARVELPFERASASGEIGPGQTVVQPGQNLWRLARNAYGEGRRYTVVYLANKEQIRNPRLIYPGQVLAIPAGQR